MIVYAETNFVFELALLREEAEHAERILRLSEEGRLQLILPAFSLAEPYESLVRRAKQRTRIHDELAAEIRELARSRPYAGLIATSRIVADILTESTQEEPNRLAAVLRRLIQHSNVIPLTGEVAVAGLAFQQSLGLSPQDALVFASVDAHLAGAPGVAKVFVNQNRRDFLNPRIIGRLAAADCRLMTSFAAARGYVESALPRT